MLQRFKYKISIKRCGQISTCNGTRNVCCFQRDAMFLCVTNEPWRVLETRLRNEFHLSEVLVAGCEVNGSCLTCSVLYLSFSGDWCFHGSLTWWEKGWSGSFSPSRFVCKQKKTKYINFHKMSVLLLAMLTKTAVLIVYTLERIRLLSSCHDEINLALFLR